uniref:Uncharacterized protein n=1 Tax=Acrobeloides nanus TaxID=290746 RepID=A0A914EJF8_9BILA
MDDLHERVQKAHESFYELSLDIEKMVRGSYPTPQFSEDNIKALVVKYFMRGLRPEIKIQVKRAFKGKNPDTIEEALQAAEEEEQLQGSCRPKDNDNREFLEATKSLTKTVDKLSDKVDNLQLSAAIQPSNGQDMVANLRPQPTAPPPYQNNFYSNQRSRYRSSNYNRLPRKFQSSMSYSDQGFRHPVSYSDQGPPMSYQPQEESTPNGRPYRGRGRGGYRMNAVSAANSEDSHRVVPPTPSLSVFRETLKNPNTEHYNRTSYAMLPEDCRVLIRDGIFESKQLKRVDESHWESPYEVPYYGFIWSNLCIEQIQYSVLRGELQTTTGENMHSDIDWDMKNCVFRDKYCITEGKTLKEMPNTKLQEVAMRAGGQMNNNINMKLNFGTFYVTQWAKRSFESTYRHICSAHNERIRLIQAWCQVDATVCMRIYLNRNDVTAERVGEVYKVTPCATVVSEKIKWDNKVEDKCYDYTPVFVKNVMLFIKPGTRELTPDASEIPCENHTVPIFQQSDGRWRSIEKKSARKCKTRRFIS